MTKVSLSCGTSQYKQQEKVSPIDQTLWSKTTTEELIY